MRLHFKVNLCMQFMHWTPHHHHDLKEYVRRREGGGEKMKHENYHARNIIIIIQKEIKIKQKQKKMR